MRLFQAWVKLFSLANSSIEIVSYHWGLQRGSGRGRKVFETISEGKKPSKPSEPTELSEHSKPN